MNKKYELVLDDKKSEGLTTLMEFEKDNPEMVREAVEKLMAEESAIEEIKKCEMAVEKDWTCPNCNHQSPIRTFDILDIQEQEIDSLKRQVEELKRKYDNYQGHDCWIVLEENDKLKSDLAGCLPLLESYEQEIEKLQRDNQLMREALEFYGNHLGMYDCVYECEGSAYGYVAGIEDDFCFVEGYPSRLKHHGKKARAVLAQIKGMRDEL